MKIALCMGRGCEGAGITRWVIETSSWLTKNLIENTVFILDDKKWGRGKNQSFLNPPVYVSKEMLPTLHDTLNEFDYVFINSVPSVKHSEWAITGFLQLVKNIKTKKILFQNDNKIASIHRNANFFEICNLCDGIVSFAITTPFYKKLIELFGTDIKSKFINLHNPFDFTQLERFRKEEHYKKITYLGRFATFKDPQRLFGFLPYTKNNNILLEMKGVERSLGALNIFYDDLEKRIPRHDIYEVNKKTIENGLKYKEEDRDFEHVYIYGPYVYEEGMQSLSSSLVGAEFYHLSADAYGDNIEYAQCEIIGVGCVPLYDYHWGENCYIWENGVRTNKRFIDIENFALFLKKDLSNIKEVVEKINDIYSNKSLHKKYLECSLEVAKEHTNSEWIFSNLLNDISKLEKTKVIKNKSLF